MINFDNIKTALRQLRELVFNNKSRLDNLVLTDNNYTDEDKAKVWETPDSLYTNGADYGEVGVWSDGNPSKENRLYRFVTLAGDGRHIAIADSNDQIAGVTTDKAGFVGNAKNYKTTDTDKNIVGIIGVVPVKTHDNTIKANDRVMSGEDGYAVKSSNKLGYRVLKVLEEGLLEIVVSVNTDMIQRIKTDMNNKADIEVVTNLTAQIGDVASDLEEEITNRHEAEAAIDKDIEALERTLEILKEQKANISDVNGAVTMLNLKIAEKLGIVEYNAQKNQYVKDGLVNSDIVLTDEEKLKIETWLGLSENYLTYYNNTPYQVNGQYVPAHKKYVDEAISKSGGNVDDVQINGQSIVSDGVASIPIADPNLSNFGLVMLNIFNGFGKASNGNLVPYNRNQWIDGRQYSGLITNATLDYAFKRAMCDGKGADWTEPEQLSARQRIGAISNEKVKLINQYTTLGTETSFVVDLSANGKGYRYVCVVIQSKDGNTYVHNSSNLLICLNAPEFQYSKCVGTWSRQAKHHAVCFDTRWGFLNATGLTVDGNNDNRSTMYTAIEYITSILICVRGTTTPFSAGTTVDVYGIE